MKKINLEQKKSLLAIIILTLVITIVLVFIYYNVKIVPMDTKDYHNKNLEDPFYINEKEITAKNIYLLKRELGVSPETNQFNPDDYVELKGMFKLEGETKIYFHLLDEEKEIIKEEFLPSLNYYEINHYYGTEEEISRCCGYVSMEEGEYYIGIFINNDILKEIPFKVLK